MEVKCSMKILIKNARLNKGKNYLVVELRTKHAAKEIKKLLNTLHCPIVKSKILSNGKFVRKVAPKDILNEKTDLILTERNAHWSHL